MTLCCSAPVKPAVKPRSSTRTVPYHDSVPLVRVLCQLYPPLYATCTHISVPFVRLLCQLYPHFYATCTPISMPLVRLLCQLYPHSYATCTPISMPLVRLLCHLCTLLCPLYVIYMPGPSRPSRGTLQYPNNPKYGTVPPTRIHISGPHINTGSR